MTETATDRPSPVIAEGDGFRITFSGQTMTLTEGQAHLLHTLLDDLLYSDPEAEAAMDAMEADPEFQAMMLEAVKQPATRLLTV